MSADLARMAATDILGVSSRSTHAEGERVDALAEKIRQCMASGIEEFLKEERGYLSKEPMNLGDSWVNYENADVVCAFCGAHMPHSPWPTNSTNIMHRPRCGKCGSPMTYCKPEPDPVVKTEGAKNGNLP